MSENIIGRVLATEKKPTTIDTFTFWTDPDLILNPFDVVKVNHINKSTTYGVIEEFQRAVDEIKKDPASLPIWQVIVGKYHPTFLGDCEKAIEWSTEIVGNWLKTGMFLNDADAESKAANVLAEFSNHDKTKAHARHIHIDECRKAGLNVIELETYMQDKEFQDCVLTIHHAFMHTFSNTAACKIVENHEGKAIVQFAQP